jgi:hypothetical protein
MVKYEEGRLVVSFETHDAQELHQALMQSVITNIKLQSTFSDAIPQAMIDANYWHLELLEGLMECPVEK